MVNRVRFLGLLCLFLFAGRTSFGQTEVRDNPSSGFMVYVTAGFGPRELSTGHGNTGHFIDINGMLSFAFMSPDHWGGSINYNYIGYSPTSIPADYGTATPEDNIKCLSFCLSRELFVSKKGITRLGLEAGPAIVNFERNSFSPNPGYHPWNWGGPPEYTVSQDRLTDLGFSLKARSQFVSRFVGFEMVVFGNVNKYHPTIGLNFNLMLGYLRKSLGPKQLPMNEE